MAGRLDSIDQPSRPTSDSDEKKSPSVPSVSRMASSRCDWLSFSCGRKRSSDETLSWS